MQMQHTLTKQSWKCIRRSGPARLGASDSALTISFLTTSSTLGHDSL